MSATMLNTSRVLPTPPGPTAVSMRCSAIAALSAARSATRPTNDVNGDGSATERAASPVVRVAAITHLQLAQHGRDMALDGAYRDEQSRRDLSVRQMLAQRHEHLSLPGRDVNLGLYQFARHLHIVHRDPHLPIAPSRPPPASSPGQLRHPAEVTYNNVSQRDSAHAGDASDIAELWHARACPADRCVLATER